MEIGFRVRRLSSAVIVHEAARTEDSRRRGRSALRIALGQEARAVVVRQFEEKQNKENFHRVERSYGHFERVFTLPDSVNPEGVKADYKNGTLTITLPKKEIAKPRQVKVQVSNN